MERLGHTWTIVVVVELMSLFDPVSVCGSQSMCDKPRLSHPLALLLWGLRMSSPSRQAVSRHTLHSGHHLCPTLVRCRRLECSCRDRRKRAKQNDTDNSWSDVVFWSVGIVTSVATFLYRPGCWVDPTTELIDERVGDPLEAIAISSDALCS